MCAQQCFKYQFQFFTLVWNVTLHVVSHQCLVLFFNLLNYLLTVGGRRLIWVDLMVVNNNLSYLIYLIFLIWFYFNFKFGQLTSDLFVSGSRFFPRNPSLLSLLFACGSALGQWFSNSFAQCTTLKKNLSLQIPPLRTNIKIQQNKFTLIRSPQYKNNKISGYNIAQFILKQYYI